MAADRAGDLVPLHPDHRGTAMTGAAMKSLHAVLIGVGVVFIAHGIDDSSGWLVAAGSVLIGISEGLRR